LDDPLAGAAEVDEPEESDESDDVDDLGDLEDLDGADAARLDLSDSGTGAPASSGISAPRSCAGKYVEDTGLT
jgi:hypothetical protein